MCRILNVSRSSYYQWLEGSQSPRLQERLHIIERIKEVHKQSKGRYGSPKITEQLKESGLQVSRPRVARIMRSLGISSIVNKKFRGSTTNSKHNYPVANNILNRNFTAAMPGQKWVSDITYIPTVSGWLYLTIVMDLYDRKIIGWSLSTSMEAAKTTLPAFRMAIGNRPKIHSLIFHSDRGVQYAANSFRDTLGRHRVIQSMSRKADCWDNAVAENFFKTLKSELVYHHKFHSVEIAKKEVFEFIEIWYNRKRKHAYLRYQSPEQFYLSQLANAA